MTQKTTIEFKVGVFVLAGLAAFILFIIFTGRASMRGRGYELKVAFSYVGGLEEGAPVRVSGVRVGEVKRIEMNYDGAPMIILVMKMRPDVRVGRHSVITIRTLGIIGEKYVEISPCQEKEFAAPGETLRGIDPVDLDRLVNMGEDLVRNLNQVVVGMSRIVQDKDVQKTVKNILQNTDEFMAGLRQVTSDKEMFTQFKRILTSAESTVSQANTFLQQAGNLSASLETTSQQIGKFLNQTQPHVEGVLTRIEELTSTSNTAVKNLSDKLASTANSFQQTAEQTRQLLNDLSSRGLLARLMKEETLVDEIKTEVELLQETTAEIKKGAEHFNEISFELKRTAEAITETSKQASQLLSEIRSGSGILPRLLSDKDTSETMLTILNNMEKISRGLREYGLWWRGTRTEKSR
ncbi:MAG: MlaD family protein [Candidatus Omnitrophica bacterium]|nr:MlaD family protein [Candidatus Omnitrophota bacterium]